MPQLSTFHSQLSASPAALPYNPALSLWLSVDPLSDKYPNLSPYTYCADNPVRLVDPDGRRIIVTGNGTEEYVSQINNMTSKKFKVAVDENGEMTYSGKAQNHTDRFIKKAIDRTDITVNIIAENNKKSFQGPDGKEYNYTKEADGIRTSGAYGGSVFISGKAFSYQYVDPVRCAELDDLVGDMTFGGYALHEFAEGYYSAEIALQNRKGDPISIRNNYKSAHSKANDICGGEWFIANDQQTACDGRVYPIGRNYRRGPVME